MARRRSKSQKKAKGRAKVAASPPDVVAAPGWDALDAALRALHGDVEPLHWAPVPHFAAGGKDPLDGISAYRVEGPPRHWHLVTYGFSELYAKETDDPDMSGFGFELTLRLPRRARERKPPTWALSFLQNIARYVFRTGNGFAPGHHMDLNGPIELGRDTAIEAIAFVEDPQLGAVRSPHGRVQFLQVVGLTLDELRASMAWDTEKLLGVLARRDPLLITDLDRRSILEDARLRKAVEAGTAEDGSSQGGTFVDGLTWARRGKSVTLRLGAITIANVVTLLRGRTGFGREFFVHGPQHALTVLPVRTRPSWKVDHAALVLRLDAALAEELADALAPVRGTHRFERLPGLALEVVPTAVKDADGNVREVVG